jgi:VIT1/CCC1 family predicted Fe2+/Mn2+ transporter
VVAPWRHGAATFAAFVTVGSIPLLGYAVSALLGVSTLLAAGALSAVALLVTGAARAPFVGRSVWRSAVEMLTIGAAAGGAAFAVGALAMHLAGQ